ncbi:VOC family protein [Novosphingobium beihaiensis]|uniref:VOC family protein n=1 Tax=Novosphingobium beihaiensis TaxID=2930389 RepID=A0ABT0BRC2_9SPHN|nr:VOC family protein [Novosphingobium beihaiensis]MCJ2187610.1 VOC family protein [Novosphingobium beihaiensis]
MAIAAMTKDQGAATAVKPAVRSIEHLSFRCFDPEETRHFYEDILGLELCAAIPTEVDADGRKVKALHMLFGMTGGGFVGFYHVPGDPRPDIYKPLDGMDLHVGMKVSSEADWKRWQERLTEAGVEFAGPLDHDFVISVYFPDPNGVMLEFTYEVDRHEEIMAGEAVNAHSALEAWTGRTGSAAA